MRAITASAVALLLVSSFIHALWNLLLKKAGGRLTFLCLFLVMIPLLYAPLTVWLIRDATVTPTAMWCAVASGLLYALYFAALAESYKHGQLSIAYPLSRGTGMMLTPIWAVPLLHDRLTALGVAGIGCLLASVVMVHLPELDKHERDWSRIIHHPSTRAALFTGVMTSVYSILDKIGVGAIEPKTHAPALYTYFAYAACAAWLLPYALTRHSMNDLRAEWRAHRRSIVAVAALCFLAYLLAMMAIRVSPISYVVPLRVTAVWFGVLLGTGVLNEGGRSVKLQAAALMMVGVGLIAWRG